MRRPHSGLANLPRGNGAPCTAVLPGSDGLFMHIVAAYRLHGGLAREADLAPGTLQQGGVRAATVRFEWSGMQWLPRFQFRTPASPTHALHRGCPEVVAELRPVYDDWRLTLWFVEPNTWLDGCRPVALIAAAPRRVHEAARADRFVARG